MANIIRIAPNFWNIRGDFKILKIINLGTHCSLVRLSSGKFVFLDAYALEPAEKQVVDELTNDGEELEAIINVHPFHTVFVKGLHEAYPDARLYGTTRHVSTLSDLPWQNELVEEKAFQDLYAQDFEFSVPDGLDFVSADPSVHSSSVLVYHPASRSLHVDDTLLYIKLLDKVQFHTKLAQSLSDRQGSSRDFKDWAEETFTRKWPGIMNLLCAHTHYLTNEQKGEERKGKNEEKDEGTAALSVINQRIMQALAGCQSTFDKHEKKYIEKSCDKSDCSVM